MKASRLIALALAPAALAGILLIGTAGAATAQPGDLGTEAQREAGRVVYNKYCSQCHGDHGDGHGIAAPYLRPAPRDFTAGKYKIRTTPNGTLPARADLERVIRRGIPYTAMPGFPTSSIDSEELENLIYVLESFSSDFEDPEAYGEPIEIPSPPAYDRERAVTEGLQVYQESGCKQCHGELGRADGGTAPTLRDDWGHYIRAADLAMPWTFRGGGTREDVFRTLSTGFNGTPMAAFTDIPEERRWLIADWIYSHADDGSLDAPYSQLLTAVGVEERLDLPQDAAAAEELFAAVPKARFPVVGQIMEPGRDFNPSARAVEVQALYSRDEIAFRVTWHDMAAETAGHNAPDLEVPLTAERLEAAAAAEGSSQEESGDIWGDAAAGGEEEGGSVWGDAEADSGGSAAGGGSVWGDAAADEGTGQDAGGSGSIWDEGPGAALAAAPVIGAVTSEFSDAVAIQLPSTLPSGVRKPYFLFGDAQNPVDVWFADLAADPSRGTARIYQGRGSGQLTEAEGAGPGLAASYDHGQWSVVFKQERRSGAGLTFDEGTFIPIAFSVWDGFNQERGNRRGLTRWFYVYLEPIERPSPVGPMAKAGLGVLALELLIIALMRRRRRKQQTAQAVGAVQGAS